MQGTNLAKIQDRSEEGMSPMTTMTTLHLQWDEPAGAASPRGWLHNDAHCVGNYLDYGPGHYRTGHTTEIYPGKVVSFCKPGDLCRECQPGNIHAMRYPDGPGTTPQDSRYVETIAEARRYVETGTV